MSLHWRADDATTWGNTITPAAENDTNIGPAVAPSVRNIPTTDLNNNNSNNGDEKENHTHGDEPWLWRLYGFGTTKAAKTLINYNDNRYNIILLRRRHPTLFGCIRRRQPSVRVNNSIIFICYNRITIVRVQSELLLYYY